MEVLRPGQPAPVLLNFHVRCPVCLILAAPMRPREFTALGAERRSRVIAAVLDGHSRANLHREIRESMREADVELVAERVWEKYPEVRVNSDNGPQSLARDFKK